MVPTYIPTLHTETQTHTETRSQAAATSAQEPHYTHRYTFMLTLKNQKVTEQKLGLRSEQCTVKPNELMEKRTHKKAVKVNLIYCTKQQLQQQQQQKQQQNNIPLQLISGNRRTPPPLQR